MGKKDKNSAPEYQPTKFDTGNLYGSSTTNKSGTTYQAPDWISNTVGTVANNINPTLNSMLSNDYSNDANFQVYQDNFNRGMQQAYDTNVLGDLTNRGLMRSSGLQASTNSFNNTMQEGLANLYDNYYNRQSNNLANLLNTSNTLYDYITGVANSSRQDANAINNYNLAKYRLENADTGSSGIGSIIGGLGNIVGGAANIYSTYKGA
jgi:hypothetical protein